MFLSQSGKKLFLGMNLFLPCFQAGEMAHKAHVKEAMYSTNRREFETQIMSVGVRQNAIMHHTKIMTDEVRENLADKQYDSWREWHKLESEKEVQKQNRLGSSWGVKFQLEESWAGRYLGVCKLYCIFVFLYLIQY